MGLSEIILQILWFIYFDFWNSEISLYFLENVKD